MSDDKEMSAEFQEHWGAKLAKEASKMSADEFAAKYAAGKSRLWGTTKLYTCVEVDGVEYLWRNDTGNYDGWNRGML